MNLIGFWAVYTKEIARTMRVWGQTLLSPVITTALYFIVFGAAIGSNMTDVGGVSYGNFIVPGLIMMTVLINSTTAAATAIYFPKWTGVIYEMLSAPLSYLEITLGFVLSAVTRVMIISAIIFGVSNLFVDINVAHPLLAIGFIFITALSFSTFGFILGLWAKGFEQLNIFPALIITPLSFLGGVFYSISILPEFWQKVVLFNPVIYMVDAFRYTFYGISDINPWISFSVTMVFLVLNLLTIMWIFRTGYRLKS